MNWLDIVLLLILVWSVATSFRKGLTREIVGLATVVIALLLGIWFYGSAGAALSPYLSSRSLANLAGFFVVFGGVMLLGAVANFIIGKFLRITGLSIVDHALGAAFGVVRATLVAIALIMGIMAFSPAGRPPESVVRSRFAPYVASAARVFASMAPLELKEGYRKTYAEVKAAWGKVVGDGSKPASDTPKEKNERKL